MRYTSDLSEAEWQLIDYCFPKAKKKGQPRKHSFHELLNAVFYVVKTGCQWRNMPKDFAPWRTVYHYFRLWKKSGLWIQIHTHLREHVRLVAGRNRHASADIINSQSVNSDERGFDAGKKVNERKRHVLVDTIGPLLHVMVLPAHIQDRDGARTLLNAFFACAPHRRVKHIWADGGYVGSLIQWAPNCWRCTIEVVKRNELHTFKVLPRRWVRANLRMVRPIATVEPRLRETGPYRRNHGLLVDDSTDVGTSAKVITHFLNRL